MYRMYKVCGAMLLLAAQCGGVAIAGGWSGIQQIDSVRVNGKGEVQVTALGADWNNPDSCGSDKAVGLHPNHEYYRELLVTVLAAHSGEQEVRFRLNDCKKMNGRQYPKIVDVQVY